MGVFGEKLCTFLRCVMVYEKGQLFLKGNNADKSVQASTVVLMKGKISAVTILMRLRGEMDRKPTRRKVAAQGAHAGARGASAGRISAQDASAARGAGSNRAKIIALALVGIVVLVAVIFGIKTAMSSQNAGGSDSSPAQTAQEETKVSFVAVGDNLPESVLGSYADAQKGEVGDGLYDYSSIYEPIKAYVQAADFAYVKEEVHLDDELGVHGYPSFNAPESLANDLIGVGFDVIGSASNHIYDWGYFGACARNREVWNSKDVVFAGTNLNEEEANTIATFEVKGITFAFLDYTYGVNGYSEDDLEWYEVNFISKDRLERDVTRAKELADVTLVAMHWGTENQTASDEYQLEYAQYLADLGVDVCWARTRM